MIVCVGSKSVSRIENLEKLHQKLNTILLHYKFVYIIMGGLNSYISIIGAIFNSCYLTVLRSLFLLRSPFWSLLINELICRMSTFRDFILCLFRIHSHAYKYAYESIVHTHTHWVVLIIIIIIIIHVRIVSLTISH